MDGCWWVFRVRQARMEGFQVVTMDECVGEIGFFTSAACKKMKNRAMVDNLGRFVEEIDMAGFKGSTAWLHWCGVAEHLEGPLAGEDIRRD